ncbi:MAG: HEPN domain-containing protein [Acidimicrobiia bacterium]
MATWRLPASKRRTPDVPARIACFLAHLAAEKALKALLIDVGVAFPRIHNLLRLAALLPDPLQEMFDPGDLAQLNPWVIEGRYPDDAIDASADVANILVELAAKVLASAQRSLLPDDPEEP